MSKNLRERKKLKTRQALIDAATTLFLDKGFDATTADEIAEAAEISRSTFFRYFKTKEAVVFPHKEERIDKLRQRIIVHEAAHPPFDAARRGHMETGIAWQTSR